jgi:hypothetical protein
MTNDQNATSKSRPSDGGQQTVDLPLLHRRSPVAAVGCSIRGGGAPSREPRIVNRGTDGVWVAECAVESVAHTRGVADDLSRPRSGVSFAGQSILKTQQ